MPIDSSFENSNLFVSYGSLKIIILEAMDLMDESVDRLNNNVSRNISILSTSTVANKKNLNTKYSIHCSLSLMDENNIVRHRYHTEPRSLYSSELTFPFIVGEEFIFNSISSASSLLITFYSISNMMKKYSSPSESTIIGHTLIPVGRLEENVSISQWYQLYKSGEGQRSAIKIECLFISEDSSIHINRRAGKKTRNSGGNEQERGNASVGTATADLTSIRHTASVDGIGSISVMGLNDMSEVESMSQYSQSNRYNSVHTNIKSTQRFFVAPSFDIDDELQLPESNSSNRSNSHKLNCGIVDYCMILGPTSTYALRPTHYVDENGKIDCLPVKFNIDPLNFLARLFPKSEFFSAIQSPFSGTSSSSPMWWAKDEELDIIIWDRLPRCDYDDFELPHKIEWFACPEGSKTILQANRPDPFISSFILNAGGDIEEQHGISFNFFIDTGPFNVDTLSRLNQLSSVLSNNKQAQLSKQEQEQLYSFLVSEIPQLDPVHRTKNLQQTKSEFMHSHKWWQRGNYSNKFEKSKIKLKLWTSVTICFLFRLPFFDQFSHCLQSAYSHSILSAIQEWENECNEIYSIHSALDNSLSLACDGDNITMDDFPPLNVNKIRRVYEALLRRFVVRPMFPCYIEKLLALLCLECPIPIIDTLSLKLTVQSSSNNANRMNSPEGKDINFELYDPENLPSCMHSIYECLLLIGPRSLVTIVCCLLSECKMLFHSRHLDKLPVICEAVKTLIYPLKWTHVYLPVIPVQLLNLVEAPVPYLLGTHSQWLKHIHLDYLADTVLIDCDSGSIDLGSLADNIIRFPSCEDRWLIMGLNSILNEHEQTYPVSPDLQIQLLFFDVLLSFLRFVPDCLFYLNPSCPLFNRPLFLSDYTVEQYRSFLEILTVTNCFHALTESIHSPDAKFFLQSALRMADMENKIILDASMSGMNEHSDISHSPKGKQLFSAPSPSHLRHSMAQTPRSNVPFLHRTPKLRMDESDIAANQDLGTSVNNVINLDDEMNLATHITTIRGLNRTISARDIVQEKLAASSSFIFRAHSSINNIADDFENGNTSPESPTRPKPSTFQKRKESSKNLLGRSFYNARNNTDLSQSQKQDFESSLTLQEVTFHLSPDQRDLSNNFSPKISISQRDDLNQFFSRDMILSGIQIANERKYRKILPQWVYHSIERFSPSLKNDDYFEIPEKEVPLNKVIVRADSVKELLKQRIFIYLSHLKRHRHWTPEHDSSKPFLYHLETKITIVSKDEEIAMLRDHSRAAINSMHAELLSINDSKFILHGFEESQNHANSISLSKPVPNDIQSFDEIFKLSQPPLSFLDEHLLLAQEHRSKLFHSWEDVAIQTNVSIEIVLQKYRAYVQQRDQSKGNIRNAALLALNSKNKSTGTDKQLSLIDSSNRTMKKLESAYSLYNNEQNTVVITYLQRVVTENNLSPTWLEESLNKCKVVLTSDHSSRMDLINMLKNAKTQQLPTTQKPPIDYNNGSGVYPLHNTAFTAFYNLFDVLLKICADKQDYLCAFGLLEIGGIYFQFIDNTSNEMDVSNEKENDQHLESSAVEFLSERVCQHPIYQNSLLWKAVMNDRLPQQIKSKKVSALSSVHAVYSEAHSLLYVMLGMNVNSARALEFIQAVASDYGLNMNEYFKLQRFMTRLWTSSHIWLDGDLQSEAPSLAQTAHSAHISSFYVKRSKSKSTSFRDKSRSQQNIQETVSRNSISSMNFLSAANANRTTKTPNGGILGEHHRSSSSDNVFNADASTAIFSSEFPDSNADEAMFRSDINLEHEVSMGNLHDPFELINAVIVNDNDEFNIPLIEVDKILNFDKLDEEDVGSDDSSPNDHKTSVNYSEHGLDEGPNNNINDVNKSRSDNMKGRKIRQKHQIDAIIQSGDQFHTAPSFVQSSYNSKALELDHKHHQSSLIPTSNKSIRDMSPSNNASVNSNKRGSYKMRIDTINRNDQPNDTIMGNGIAESEGGESFVSYTLLELKELSEIKITKFHCTENWLAGGTSDGNIHLVDLSSGKLETTLKQFIPSYGSSGKHTYHDITALSTTNNKNSKNNHLFSGSSSGLIKVWNLPRKLNFSNHPLSSSSTSVSNHPTGSSKADQSIGTIRCHASTITVLSPLSSDTTSSHDSSTGNNNNNGWILASGDSNGDIAISRSIDEIRSDGANTSKSNLIDITSCTASTRSFQGGHVVVRPWSSSCPGGHSITCLEWFKSGLSDSNAKVDLRLLSGSMNGFISILDANTGSPIYHVEGHRMKVIKLLSVRTNEFLSCSSDRSIKLWDIRVRSYATRPVAALMNGGALEGRSLARDNHNRCGESAVTDMAVGGGENSMLVSATADGVLRLWDLRHDFNVPCTILKGHNDRISNIVWNYKSGNNQMNENSLFLDSKSKQNQFEISNNDNTNGHSHGHGQDQPFITASYDGTVKSWDSISRKCVNFVDSSSKSNQLVEPVVGSGGGGLIEMQMSRFPVVQPLSTGINSSVTRSAGQASSHVLMSRSCIVTRGWDNSIRAFHKDSPI
eukprot:gene9228-12441_t